MSATEIDSALQRLVDQWIAPPLVVHGFRKVRHRFVRDAGETIQIVEMQRSVGSTKEQIKFTLNLGVLSKRLRTFFNPHARSTMSIDDCHWQIRLHQLAPSAVPEWATITRDSDVDELGRGIRMWLQIYALPAFDHYMFDSRLLELWMTGVAPGLTRFSRLMNLAVLLKTAGRMDDLGIVMTDLRELTRGKPIEARVEDLQTKLLDERLD